MARFRDWVDLGKSTFRSLSSDDMTSLYSLEWPETKKMLMAEHRRDIEQDPRAFRRWLRTVSAIFYGLAKKLAPHRRLLFAFAFIAFFVCLLNLASHTSRAPVWVAAETAATFLIMVLLLAMELIDKVKFRDELQLARDLQASLIPHQMPLLPDWEVAAFNRIANTVGGDIYDFVPLPDGRVGVLFGDASGHGMAAGLVMAVAHASFRTQLEVDPSPAAISATMNRILCRTGGPRSFFAFCYLLLSPDGSFQATIAGHPPVLKIDNDGKVVQRIGRGAYPLGVKSALTWEVVEGSLAPGERLLLHSDGLAESRNLTDHEFGDAYVEVIAGWHPTATARTLLDTILGEWRSFMGRAVPDDDVSLAILRRK
jgi:hypothetical protein